MSYFNLFKCYQAVLFVSSGRFPEFYVFFFFSFSDFAIENCSIIFLSAIKHKDDVHPVNQASKSKSIVIVLSRLLLV